MVADYGFHRVVLKALWTSLLLGAPLQYHPPPSISYSPDSVPLSLLMFSLPLIRKPCSVTRNRSHHPCVDPWEAASRGRSIEGLTGWRGWRRWCEYPTYWRRPRSGLETSYNASSKTFADAGTKHVPLHLHHDLWFASLQSPPACPTNLTPTLSLRLATSLWHLSTTHILLSLAHWGLPYCERL